jgi:hypothetical protein
VLLNAPLSLGLGPVLAAVPVIQQAVTSTQAVVDALGTGEPTNVVNAIQHGIADVSTKAIAPGTATTTAINTVRGQIAGALDQPLPSSLTAANATTSAAATTVAVTTAPQAKAIESPAASAPAAEAPAPADTGSSAEASKPSEASGNIAGTTDLTNGQQGRTRRHRHKGRQPGQGSPRGCRRFGSDLGSKFGDTVRKLTGIGGKSSGGSEAGASAGAGSGATGGSGGSSK